MLASRKHISRIALLCFIVFLTAACGLMKKHKLTVGQAQNTNVTVPDDTSAPSAALPSAALPSTVKSQTANAPTVEIDTSLDQDIRTRHMEEKITRLENRIEQLENKPDSQTKPSSSPEQEQASLTPPAPTKPKQPVPPAEPEYSDPVELYKKGRTLMLERKIPEARKLFLNFVKNFPEHELATNALYWLGECSYTTGEYEKAAKIFKMLVKTYPEAKKVPDALLKTGLAYLSIDDVKKANYYFKQVITRYPFSPAADKAQQKLPQTQ